MSRSRIATWVVAWLVVVAVGSTLVWVVISRVGAGLVSSDDPVVATGGPSSRAKEQSSPSPSPRVPSAPALERRTWQGPGGLVVAQCDGSSISRVSLLPDNGYQVELKEDGPDQLEVEFEGREDESGSSSSVHAVCVDGVPVFDNEIETDD